MNLQCFCRGALTLAIPLRAVRYHGRVTSGMIMSVDTCQICLAEPGAAHATSMLTYLRQYHGVVHERACVGFVSRAHQQAVSSMLTSVSCACWRYRHYCVVHNNILHSSSVLICQVVPVKHEKAVK